MELTVCRRDETSKDDVTPENITLALQDAYGDKIEFVILDNPDANQYMQTANGWHIEYQVDLTHYVVDHVPLETATRLFLDFSNNDHAWKSAVDWQVNQEVTDRLQSPTLIERDNEEVDLDTDFEVDSEGILRWTVPIDIWAPKELESWKQRISVFQNRTSNKSKVYRWEWEALLRPIWESHPISGERHWRDQLRPGIKQEFDKLIPVAKDTAVRMEALFWQQKLHGLDVETISSISTMRRMLKDTREVDDFLGNIEDVFPELQERLYRLKEKFAWHRAKKKIDESEIAEALGRASKSARLRIEAGVMLRQDWKEVFAGEEVPKEEADKISQAHMQ